MSEKKTIDVRWNLENSYADLPDIFFSRVNPSPVPSPKLAFFNESLAEYLGLNSQGLQSEQGVSVMAGNRIPEGSKPIAQAYAGHQFGYFNKLGDGRAILLGEQMTPHGERYDIQLKGSGETPYSRRGDGRAVLGPMLREYIISEAMLGLGIPTTRSLAVVTTGESIARQTVEPGAILTRVAASHIRVGTFQYAASYGNVDELQVLADYTIARHYPEIKDKEKPYLSFLNEVIKRQAKLVAKWQLVGFIHGVMNTDNMTISGESIDYGPCAFMDTYDPATVFSSIDTHGRYAYGNQPPIAAWNLSRFSETLLPLLHENEEEAIKLAQEAIHHFSELYNQYWLEGMRAKLGLFDSVEKDKVLIEELFSLMKKYRADYTNTFIGLTFDKLEGTDLFSSTEFSKWHQKWQERRDQQQESKEASHKLMKDNNPAVIPRNHRVEEALEAASKKGDYSVMERLLKVLADPYAHTPEQEEYASLPAPSCGPYRTYCGT
ncbi:protein adenylyltransferase SelO [Alkaliphilus hydrothermalis]|uniref:Protein nucleotidyltransferase YdiU n=1 Tax=Alkaliphilus hydrothermalis TaxID=1482730 RepID=A0ABS2NMT3_9FIRM|nr:YdiU family protein [Alkaliphilus hydrothermalis]MBM7613884.1 uncharacterized protein YdiU (UPF0061 family) [Alkaliphilus hydrothermalis]